MLPFLDIYTNPEKKSILFVEIYMLHIVQVAIRLYITEKSPHLQISSCIKRVEENKNKGEPFINNEHQKTKVYKKSSS